MFGGGFPFGFGHGGEDDDEDIGGGEVDNTEYYKLLEVQKNATQEEIKSAFKRLAKVHHPDRKGGNAEKFHKIREAYQTLEDPNKRKMYDKFGKNGPQQGGGDDLLNMFFGGGGGGRQQSRGMAKVKATQKPLKITLENIYNGEMLKIKHSRTRCCEACNGKGGKNVQTCKTCKGKGRVVQMFQMGPGMYQQVQKNCDKCNGQGQIIGEGGKCKACQGKKILEKEKLLDVPVDKGVPNGFPIKLSGEGNQIPDAMAGDLIFVTQEQPHEVFTRKGADLFMKKKISLVESLTGLEFKIRHLDGTQYSIYSGKGEILGDGDKKVVRGMGMPFHKDPMSHGNLIIEFHVIMPKRGELSAAQIDLLTALLPGKVNKRPKDDNYEMLDDFDPESRNTSEEGGFKKEEEEQYEEGGATTCGAQ